MVIIIAREASSQMLKGILQGCLLILLSQKELYGYAISQALAQYGFADIPKGTIYPLLLNMEKKGLITSERRASAEGPMRKYYHTTSLGLQAKQIFIADWGILANGVTALLKQEG